MPVRWAGSALETRCVAKNWVTKREDWLPHGTGHRSVPRAEQRQSFVGAAYQVRHPAAPCNGLCDSTGGNRSGGPPAIFE